MKVHWERTGLVLVLAIVLFTFGCGGSQDDSTPPTGSTDFVLDGTVVGLNTGESINLATESGVHTIFGLGPEAYWQSLGLEFPAVGEQIRVTGFEEIDGGNTRKVAVTMLVDGMEVPLRDPNTGAPLFNILEGEPFSYSGTVVRILPRFAMVLKTAEGEKTVYSLGPNRYWESLNVDYPFIGDDVLVEGYTVNHRGRPVDVAMSVTIGEDKVQLRDPDTGAILWEIYVKPGDLPELFKKILEGTPFTYEGTVLSYAPGHGMELAVGEEVVKVWGVGPPMYWDVLDIEMPGLGDPIQVTGFTVDFFGTEVNILMTVMTEGYEVLLRDEETGVPLWWQGRLARYRPGFCPGPHESILEGTPFTLEGQVDTHLSHRGVALTTADGSVNVYGLGPTRYWVAAGTTYPGLGETIKVEGYIVEIQHIEFYIAMKVTKGADEILLRDESDGTPLWCIHDGE